MPSSESQTRGNSGPDTLRVALCQLDTVVGDLAGNSGRILEAHREAESRGADVLLLPELALTGYPPEDLLLKPGFLADQLAAVESLAGGLSGHCVAVVGFVEGALPCGEAHDPREGPWNAAAVIHDGRIAATYRKQALPNYGVFDERRYFDAGEPDQPLLVIGGVVVGVNICEDIWIADGPTEQMARDGARLILNINASPFRAGRPAEREAVVAERIAGTGVPVAYVNQVGGQDDLVFDGGSMVSGLDGPIARAEQFAEDLVVADVEVAAGRDPGREVVEVSAARAAAPVPLGPVPLHPRLEGPEELWRALCLGTADYVSKNGFTDVVVGLSGGIDSALVAAIATDALGAGHTHVVLMPSRFSSSHSVDDARELASNLGIDQRTIGIEPAHSALLEMLAPSFEGTGEDLTEENLQSRIRGVVLMALSNKFGWLVLTTGNKSETAVGYSTLYGDTAGALAVIKDVPKLTVYELCRWRNERAGGPWIPEKVLTKAPSAELRHGQRDDQSLPPYEVLDPLISDYVDGDLTASQLVERGHDPELVRRVATLVDVAEYKRRQSPPGLRASAKAFGRDRRPDLERLPRLILRERPERCRQALPVPLVEARVEQVTHAGLVDHRGLGVAPEALGGEAGVDAAPVVAARLAHDEPAPHERVEAPRETAGREAHQGCQLVHPRRQVLGMRKVVEHLELREAHVGAPQQLPVDPLGHHCVGAQQRLPHRLAVDTAGGAVDGASGPVAHVPSGRVHLGHRGLLVQSRSERFGPAALGCPHKHTEAPPWSRERSSPAHAGAGPILRRMDDEPANGPGGGFLDLASSSEQIAVHRFVERALFELVGRWSLEAASSGPAAAAEFFSVQSANHAWRLEQWVQRSPRSLVHDEGPGSTGWAEALGRAGALDDHRLRLVVHAQVLAPCLAARYRRHGASAGAAADGGVLRWLGIAHRDVLEAVSRGSELLCEPSPAAMPASAGTDLLAVLGPLTRDGC
ncbi:MAG: NAD+ synthase [Microthrixaceae bacterium]